MKCIWILRFLRTKIKCVKEYLNAQSKEYDPETAVIKITGLIATNIY